MTVTFTDMRSRFSAFFEAIIDLHRKAPVQHAGHGPDHDITVAALTLKIAPDYDTAVLAWCAAMLHSIDRMVGGDEDAAAEVISFTMSKLDNGISEKDRAIIFSAAMRHAELNKGDQSLVQQVLMDADRLANLMPLVIIRAGQHFSSVPAVEFDFLDGEKNPESTHRKPKSVVDNMRSVLEFGPMLRIPKAIGMAQEYLADIRRFVADVERTHKELGLTDVRF